MPDYVQISAQIAAATRDRLDQYARETGMKKSRIVDQAIEEYLVLQDEIPEEYIVPTVMVVDADSWDMIISEIEGPSNPTPALRELMQHPSMLDED